MRSPLRRLAGWTLALALGGMSLGACSSGAPAKAKPSAPVNVTPGVSAKPGLGNASVIPTGTSPPPACDQPKPIDQPTWVPRDLPMLPGTYPYKNYGLEGGYQRALFVVPGPLTAFARFVLAEWPKAGWILGRGDSEANEVEASFTKAPAFGAFKAAGQFCAPAYNILLLVYVVDREAAISVGGSPTPSTSPS